MTEFSFEAWPAVEPKWHDGAHRSPPWDTMEHHVDLGCGMLKKARIGVDRYPAPGVDVVADLNRGRLPFGTNEIQSIISHHALEHIGDGFIPLMDDIYRVLVPGGILRVIVPLFPSYSAVADPDHCRYFMEGTFDAFCGTPGDTPQNCWLASFSVPYTKARFEKLDEDITPRCEPEKHWTPEDAREMRVTLRAMK